MIEENDKEGEEIDATKKCCSFACSPAPSSKRKSLIIEFEDGSVKLCRFHHFKSPTDWAIIATALDHLTLKDFGEPKLCAHLGHTTTSQGVIVKHVSRKDKKTKLQLVISFLKTNNYFSFQFFLHKSSFFAHFNVLCCGPFFVLKLNGKVLAKMEILIY